MSIDKLQEDLAEMTETLESIQVQLMRCGVKEVPKQSKHPTKKDYLIEALLGMLSIASLFIGIFSRAQDDKLILMIVCIVFGGITLAALAVFRIKRIEIPSLVQLYNQQKAEIEELQEKLQIYSAQE